MAPSTEHATAAPGGPAWQDDPQPWATYEQQWSPPPLAPAPGHPGGGEPPQGRRHRQGAGARRRFGALALGAALVAGAGAGAVTAALIGGSKTVVTSPVSTTAAATFANSTGASTEAVIAKIEPALVDIHTTGTSSSASSAFGTGTNPFGGETSTTEAAGTGMIISSDGLVLTNAHVLEGATSITVTYDGTTATHAATLVGEDAAKDIALIQIEGASGLPTVTFGDSSTAVSGDQVLAIGNALDLQDGGFTASQGIISGLGRSIQTDNDESLTGLLQTSAPISSGDSGGPLVNASGQVIGMDTASAASSGSNTASDVGFAIPSNEITALIARLEKGSIGQTTVGSSSSSSTNPYGSYGGFGD